MDEKIQNGSLCFDTEFSSNVVTFDLEFNTSSLQFTSDMGVVYISDATPYEGPYEVTPKATAVELETKGKEMLENLTVKEIPTWQVSNEYGKTFIIGE